jgi:L-rhamnose mutarotase
MRTAFTMKLKPGFSGEYKKRHAEIWPELAGLLRASGIRNYSIYLDEATNTLFAYQENDGAKGSQALGENPIVQRWWAFMADIMETNADHSPVSAQLTEMFHLE